MNQIREGRLRYADLVHDEPWGVGQARPSPLSRGLPASRRSVPSVRVAWSRALLATRTNKEKGNDWITTHRSQGFQHQLGGRWGVHPCRCGELDALNDQGSKQLAITDPFEGWSRTILCFKVRSTKWSSSGKDGRLHEALDPLRQEYEAEME